MLRLTFLALETDSKTILNDYALVAITLIYGCQLKMNGKIVLDNKVKNTSKERKRYFNKQHLIIISQEFFQIVNPLE